MISSVGWCYPVYPMDRKVVILAQKDVSIWMKNYMGYCIRI